MITVWIGYDSQFSANIPKQVESITRNTSEVTIRFLHLSALDKILSRPKTETQSTDSAFTRWLVPYLSGYEGWHIYMDSDMMVRRDLNDLIQLCDDSKAVMLVKHPKYKLEQTKFNTKPQTDYDRKFWSSLMVFNASQCKTLTSTYVNTASGLDLHQFKWIDDELIGSLPREWNHLVGCEPPNPNAAIVHWTLGGPWFDEFKDCEYNQEWLGSRFS